MNLRDLTYIVAIADAGGMARAARVCNVGQPTLSIQVKKLEEYLGLTLFERTNKQLRVTEAGKTIIAIARHIVAESTRLRDTARMLADPFALPLRLGVFPTLAPYLLPHVMPAVNRAFPILTLRLVEEKSPVLSQQLHAGEIDAVLSSLNADGSGEGGDVESTLLFDDPFLLACATSHPLAKRPFITRQDLKNAKLMLLDDGHCLRDQALEVCALTHAREDGEFRATSLETLRHMVASGAGITLIPRIAATPAANLVYIPFRKAEAPVRHIGLVWRKTAPQSALMHELASVLKRAVKDTPK